MARRLLAVAVAYLLIAACGGPPSRVSTAQRETPAVPASPTVPALAPVAVAPGAGVAWLARAGQMKGITPDGRELSVEGDPIANAANGMGWGLRSPDGGRLFLVSSGRLKVVSAVDGNQLAAIDLPAGWTEGPGALAGSVSPDGRWLALAANRSMNLVVIDLDRGETKAVGQMTPAPGMRPNPWAILALPDGRVLMITASGSATLMSAHGERLDVEARSTDESAACNGPAPTLTLAPDGSAVMYCAFNGGVSWLDVNTLRINARHHARIGNPFWGAPVFSADRSLLYVYDAWKGAVTRIDVIHRSIAVPVDTLRASSRLRLPFVKDVYAKGPNFSAALAPDGAIFYVTGTQGQATGVYAIDTVSWAKKAQWLDGRKLVAVWAAPDGAALYALGQLGIVLDIINPTSGSVRSVRLAGPVDHFSIP